jgi:hypothetical protein
MILTSNAGELVSRDMLCDETKVLVKSLREKYQEMPVITGKVDDEAGSILTVWMNLTNESWTILATNKDYSCVIGVGQKLKVIEYNKKGTI